MATAASANQGKTSAAGTKTTEPRSDARRRACGRAPAARPPFPSRAANAALKKAGGDEEHGDPPADGETERDLVGDGDDEPERERRKKGRP